MELYKIWGFNKKEETKYNRHIFPHWSESLQGYLDNWNHQDTRQIGLGKSYHVNIVICLWKLWGNCISSSWSV